MEMRLSLNSTSVTLDTPLLLMLQLFDWRRSCHRSSRWRRGCCIILHLMILSITIIIIIIISSRYYLFQTRARLFCKPQL